MNELRQILNRISEQRKAKATPRFVPRPQIPPSAFQRLTDPTNFSLGPPPDPAVKYLTPGTQEQSTSEIGPLFPGTQRVRYLSHVIMNEKTLSQSFQFTEIGKTVDTKSNEIPKLQGDFGTKQSTNPFG